MNIPYQYEPEIRLKNDKIAECFPAKKIVFIDNDNDLIDYDTGQDNSSDFDVALSFIDAPDKMT